MRIRFLGRRFSFDVPAGRAAVVERLRRNYSEIDANQGRFSAFLSERRALLLDGWASKDIPFLTASLDDCEAGCRISGRTSISMVHGLLFVMALAAMWQVLSHFTAGHRDDSLSEHIGFLVLLVLSFPIPTFLTDRTGRELLLALKMWATVDWETGALRWAAIPVTRRVTVDTAGLSERVITDAASMFRILSFLHPESGALILKRGEGDNLQFNRTDARFHIDRRSPGEPRPLRALASIEPARDTFSLEEAMDVAMDYLSDKPLDTHVSWQRFG